MAEEETPKRNFFDITQYPEKTRKIIFGVFVGLVAVIVGLAMFIISPANEKRIADEEPSSATATQAPVDADTITSPGGEALTSTEDLALQTPQGELPKNEEEEAAAAQQKIIEQSLQREREQTDAVVRDEHEHIENAEALKALASNGMLEYCTDNPDETKEDKQARMKPYFHEDNSDYQSPQSLFFLQKCSVEGVTEPSHDANENVVIYVGVAWAAQFDEASPAETGYTQYTVIVDNNGIVSFND